MLALYERPNLAVTSAPAESLQRTPVRYPPKAWCPSDRTATAHRRRFVPLAEVAAGIATLPDWGATHYADELRELDSAVDDGDDDPWNQRR